VRTRKVAVLVADGVDASVVSRMQKGLADAGAVGRLVGPRIGPLKGSDGTTVEADASLENEASAVFDAVVLPGGDPAVAALARDGRAVEFVRDQFRHCKTILAVGAATKLLDAAGIPPAHEDGGLIRAADSRRDASAAFIGALARHRHFERETDPPLI
jgi:catalase